MEVSRNRTRLVRSKVEEEERSIELDGSTNFKAFFFFFFSLPRGVCRMPSRMGRPELLSPPSWYWGPICGDRDVRQ